jgi:uncharacterized membrane protein
MTDAHAVPAPGVNETGRVEAFSDGVFAIAITLLILEIQVPANAPDHALARELVRLWPSYLAYIASFMTIGVMWLNHHRLFTLIQKSDDGLIGINLMLLFGVTWIPFPTALLAAHLGGRGERIAGILYAGSFFYIALIFALLRWYATANGLMVQHGDVRGIKRQYAVGPLMYVVLVGIAAWNGTACLVVSVLYGVYFALPPRLWRRRRTAGAKGRAIA